MQKPPLTRNVVCPRIYQGTKCAGVMYVLKPNETPGRLARGRNRREKRKIRCENCAHEMDLDLIVRPTE